MNWYTADEGSLPQKTEWRECEITKERKARAFQVRSIDRRTWDDFSPDQKQAAQEIYYGAREYLKHMGPRVSRYTDAVAGMPYDNEKREREVWDALKKWAKECANYKVSTHMVIDYLIIGKSMVEIDRENKRRKGTAKKNLLEALDIYSQIRGWRVRY